MSEPASLRRIQQWLGAEIVAGAEIGAPPPSPGALLRSTSKLTAAQRLGLYRRSHRLRLLDAMRASYPGLRHMLGEELFDEFALDYLRARPSRGYALQRLGEGFPDHLAATRPDLGGPREAWPDLMIDLAKLELAFAEAYDAPGIEGRHPPTSADLPTAPDAAWRVASVEAVPCLALLRSSFPAGPYLSAVRRGEEPPPPVPGESFLAVSRRDYAVTLTPLEAREHELLERLVDGGRLDAAASAAGLELVEAWALLRDWADRSFFDALRPGHPPPPPAPRSTHSEKEYA